MPSPRRAVAKQRKVALSKAPTISRKIPKAGFFLTRQCSTRHTNSQTQRTNAAQTRANTRQVLRVQIGLYRYDE